MSCQMIIRIDENKKQSLSRLAQSEGKSTSQVLRDLIDGYIQERDMGPYIDGLWERIGKKFKARRISPIRIQGIIQQVRREAQKSPKN